LPKSTHESWRITAPEPVWGLMHKIRLVGWSLAVLSI